MYDDATAQLLARYTFDGDVTDSSGNGNDCSAYGSVSYAEDRFGNAASALSEQY